MKPRHHKSTGFIVSRQRLVVVIIDINVPVVTCHASKQSSVMAMKGDYTPSRLNALMYQRLVARSTYGPLDLSISICDVTQRTTREQYLEYYGRGSVFFGPAFYSPDIFSSIFQSCIFRSCLLHPVFSSSLLHHQSVVDFSWELGSAEIAGMYTIKDQTLTDRFRL